MALFSKKKRTRASGTTVPKRPDFETVYEEYHPRVFRYVLSKTGRPDVADELAQEVMLAVYRNYESYDSKKASLATWIFFIAKNRLKNYYRSYANLRSESLDAKEGFDAPSDEDPIEQSVEFEELRVLIGRALAELDERERAIIEGFFLHDKTNVQLAEELDMTASNVGVLKKRTLAKLRLSLSLLGYDAGE